MTLYDIHRRCTLRQTYPHDLQMYKDPPLGRMSFLDLYDTSIERLKVLLLVDRTYLGNPESSLSHFKNILIQKLESAGLSSFIKLMNSPGCKSHTNDQLYLRIRDHIGHFMLRWAFTFDIEKRNWFLRQELRLFQCRFSALNKEGVKEFMRLIGFDYKPISDSEKQKVAEFLKICSGSESFSCTQFYKVPFQEVKSLVGKRRVYLKEGMAYVPETRIGCIFSKRFISTLVTNLLCARDSSWFPSYDPRLSYIFKKLTSLLQSAICKLNRATGPRNISLNDLDKYAKQCYPLCMRRIHEHLRTEHHLRHGGRVQYLLFLKGIGLQLKDALQLWRDEFTKKVTEVRFDKEYRYSVLHLYGAVGKRANYPPFSCEKIIEGYVGSSDCHGCPFNNTHADIKKILTSYGLAQEDIDTITALSDGGKCRMACAKYFEITYNSALHNIFDSPNEYFNRSWDILSYDDPGTSCVSMECDKES